MKKLMMGLLVLVGLVFSSCPYSAPVPLSQPEKQDMSSLFGRWYLQNEDEYPAYYEIEIWENKGPEMSLVKYNYDTEVEAYTQDTRYRGWTTDIGDTTFLNVEDANQPGTFYFYKLDILNSSEFLLFEVTDNIDEEFTDSGSLYKFFRKYKSLSFFYNNGEEKYARSMMSSGGDTGEM